MVTVIDSSTGRLARLERLRALMESAGVDTLLLRRHANFAWYTGGADSRVDHASPLGVADVLVSADAERVITNAIEAPRLREEQTPELEVLEYPWHEGPDQLLGELVGGGRLAADVALDGAARLEADVAVLRRVLDADAIERLRAVGADAVGALADAAAELSPGMDEHQAAAIIASCCLRRDLHASVLLAAADGRIARWRHPIPAGARIEGRAMLVVSAERGGLYANTTRFVNFEDPGPELRRRQGACDEILSRMREEATVPGRTLADAFVSCTGFYADAGFPDEWRLHHQGGMTGYGSREVIATPSTEDQIEVGQAFAWNPSVTGAKAEETFVLLDSGPEVVTA